MTVETIFNLRKSGKLTDDRMTVYLSMLMEARPETLLSTQKTILEKIMGMEHSKIDNIHCADIDFKDAPDFVDAYIDSANYCGVPMTEDQLNEINEDSEFVYDAVQKQIY